MRFAICWNSGPGTTSGSASSALAIASPASAALPCSARTSARRRNPRAQPGGAASMAPSASSSASSSLPRLRKAMDRSHSVEPSSRCIDGDSWVGLGGAHWGSQRRVVATRTSDCDRARLEAATAARDFPAAARSPNCRNA